MRPGDRPPVRRSSNRPLNVGPLQVLEGPPGQAALLLVWHAAHLSPDALDGTRADTDSLPTAFAIIVAVQWVASAGGSVRVSATTRLAISDPSVVLGASYDKGRSSVCGRHCCPVLETAEDFHAVGGRHEQIMSRSWSVSRPSARISAMVCSDLSSPYTSRQTVTVRVVGAA
jgi:hypothetical protein